MIFRRASQPLSRLISQLRTSSTASRTQRKPRPRLTLQNARPFYNRDRRGARPLDIAKLFFVLPFTLWIGEFSRIYYYRVGYCLDALKEGDPELQQEAKTQRTHGREAQLKEVQTLLNKDPHQVILVTGANEAGKSHFVTTLLRGVNDKRGGKNGITRIQLANIVDSVSTFTFTLVEAFNLKWLSMRYSLIDVLPFAGSEILVMKERFSDRDLAQALRVVTDALKQHASSSKGNSERPIIVIDGLAEGDGWTQTPEGKQCLDRLFQWCIYATKEKQLAHIILTGNEGLVLNLTDQNRLTRGHIKVVGLKDLLDSDARELVRHELPDASDEEVGKITKTFGGFVHDLRGSCRDIRARLGVLEDSLNIETRSRIVDEVISTRYWLQVERVTSAFAKGRDDHIDDEEEESPTDGEDEEMDPYLDPLKSIYSEAQASQNSSTIQNDGDADTVTYTKLQLWKTLQLLVDSKTGAVSFAELRDEVFHNDKNPLLELMNDDVLGFGIDDHTASENTWKVKPATKALDMAFKHIVRDSNLMKRFEKVERRSIYQEKIRQVNQERRELWKDRRNLEQRKASITSTVELGEKLGRRRAARNTLSTIYDSIIKEERDTLEKDKELREKIKNLEQKLEEEDAESEVKNPKSFRPVADSKDLKSFGPVNEVLKQLKAAMQRITQRYGTVALANRTPDSNDIWIAFKELDSKERGTFNEYDIVRVIRENTGKEVDIESARRLILSIDMDDDKQVDFDEFVALLNSQGKKGNDNSDRKLTTMIRKATKA